MEWEEIERILLMAYDRIEQTIGKVCIVRDKNEYHLINIEDGSVLFEKFHSYYVLEHGYIVLYSDRDINSSSVYSALQNEIWKIPNSPRYFSYRRYTLFCNSDYTFADIAVFSNKTGMLINRVIHTIENKLVQKVKIDNFRYVELKRQELNGNTIQDMMKKRFNYDITYRIKTSIIRGIYNSIKKIKEKSFIWSGKK